MATEPAPGACPDGRCDGSGFLYDAETRQAYACSCRPVRLARKRAAAVTRRLPRRFRDVSFDREPVPSIERRNPPLIREVRRYVASIGDRLDEGRGVWFTGDVGTGKTTLAMLVSKAAMEADRTVAIYSLPRLLGLLRDTFGDDARHSLSDLLDRLCAVDLLHVDDVGAEQTSAWVLEQLYTIVNTRYEDGKAMVLTTNLDHDALEAQIGSRTVSRLYEMCGRPLPMFGQDWRREQDFELPAADRRAAERADPPHTEPDLADDAFWEGAAEPSRYGTPRAGLGRRRLD
jgi:DNA replication protein DnaC